MTEYLPIIIVAAIIGAFALVFLVAYAFLRRRQKKSGERNMADREIIRRLLSYAKPFRKQFALVFAVMVVSIAIRICLNSSLCTNTPAGYSNGLPPMAAAIMQIER